MRVWKLEASRDGTWMPSRWGFALAGSASEALELAKLTSGLPFNRVHAKPTEMIWLGATGKILEWDP